MPTKTTQERVTELRLQFPVSSGQQHRKTENEWVPVSPKKREIPAVPLIKPKLPDIVELPPQLPQLPSFQPPQPILPIMSVPSPIPGPQVYPNLPNVEPTSISNLQQNEVQNNTQVI